MYTIAIDESNTHQQTGKSTIVLVYILTKNTPELENRIIKLENQLKINYFHWPKHNWQIKEKFIKEIIKGNFTLKVALMRNPVKNLSKGLEWLLQHLITEAEINKIIIDGQKPKWYSQQLKKILRDKGISVKKIKTVRSKSYPLIRLADCFAGLICYYYNNKDKKNKRALKAQELYKLSKIKIALQMEGQLTE